jgi:tripartite-type tricarboxylate transporter receptor subunit TctC
MIARFAGVMSLTVLFSSLFMPHSVQAQANDFPNKTIKIIVPYSAGGGTDIIARRLAQGLGPVLKQSVIVENKPGANGIIGTDIVAKSEPDGHTVVLVVATHLLNPLLTKNMPYDTFTDLIGVTMVAQSPLVFVTSSAFPAKTMPDFTQAMRAKPATYSYGSSENMTKMVGAMYANEEKLDMVSVTYKGGAPLMTDVVGGSTTVGVTSILTAKSFLDAGRLTALAVTSQARSPALPNVPTMIESGIKDFDITMSYSLFAPAKTPMANLVKLQQAVYEVVNSPDMKATLAEQAATPVASTVQAFNEQVKKDTVFLQGLAKKIGLQGD